MKLVIDANILFAALIKEGHTRHLLIRSDIEFFIPQYILDEFAEHLATIQTKTGATEGELRELLKELVDMGDIKTVKNEESKHFIPEAKAISPDVEDVEYLALCMHLKCPLWTNDSLLKKQDQVSILTTKELTKILGQPSLPKLKEKDIQEIAISLGKKVSGRR